MADAAFELAVKDLLAGKTTFEQIQGACKHFADQIAKNMPRDVGFALIMKGRGDEKYRMVATLARADLARTLKYAEREMSENGSGLLRPG